MAEPTDAVDRAAMTAFRRMKSIQPARPLILRVRRRGARMTDEDRAPYRQHVRDLAAFGHRGSATDHERRAADHLAHELRGLDPTREPFRGSRSWGWRLLLHVTVAAVYAPGGSRPGIATV